MKNKINRLLSVCLLIVLVLPSSASAMDLKMKGGILDKYVIEPLSNLFLPFFFPADSQVASVYNIVISRPETSTVTPTTLVVSSKENILTPFFSSGISKDEIFSYINSIFSNLPPSTTVQNITNTYVRGGGTEGLADSVGKSINTLESRIDSLSISSGSDWSLSGSDVYRSSGNVGIGTSNPLSKLHVSTLDSEQILLTLEGTDSQNSPLLVFDGSVGTLFQRPTTSSLNSVNWSMIVNQNPFTDNSGVGGENYNNEVTAIGWNLANTVGNPSTVGTAAFWDNWEYKYNVGGKYMHERHMEAIDTSGGRHRFFSFAVPHDGGSGSSHLLAVDDVSWGPYTYTTPVIQWDLKDNVAYFGSSTATYILNFNKNNSAFMQQRNAADSAYLTLPYYNSSDQLILNGQIVHNATAPSSSHAGVALNFSGTPANGSSALSVNYPTATNATLTGIGAYGSTNWDFISDLRNSNTSANSAAVQWIRTDASAGWAYSRYSLGSGNDAWTVGKDGSGDFVIAGYNPGTDISLKINKITRNIGIATTTPWRTLSVNGTVAVPGLVNDSTGYYACVNTVTGQLATSTGVCGASSIKYKENVQNISYGLNEVMKLRPVSFDYKQSYIKNAPKQIGFIAEEVDGVVPEVVSRDQSGEIQGLDYPKFAAVLVKALQELNDKIDNLLALVKETFDEYLASNEVYIRGVTTNSLEVNGPIKVGGDICVDDTCITKEQFKELILRSGVGAVQQVDNSLDIVGSGGEGENEEVDIASSTPEIISETIEENVTTTEEVATTLEVVE